jgi:indole-3-glycerol phosphate synthase
MDVNLHQTERIMEQFSGNHGIIVSESGLDSPKDLRRLKRCGVAGFLIGTAIMSSDDVEKKVRHFVEA